MRETILKMRTVPMKILIVDDHALVRLGLAQLIADEPDLEVCGMRVTSLKLLKGSASRNPIL